LARFWGTIGVIFSKKLAFAKLYPMPKIFNIPLKSRVNTIYIYKIEIIRGYFWILAVNSYNGSGRSYYKNSFLLAIISQIVFVFYTR